MVTANELKAVRQANRQAYRRHREAESAIVAEERKDAVFVLSLYCFPINNSSSGSSDDKDVIYCRQNT